MTGNGDIHRLRQLGTTYSLVEAEPHADAICAAVRTGKVQVVAAPRSLAFAVSLMADLKVSEILRRASGRTQPRRCPSVAGSR